MSCFENQKQTTSVNIFFEKNLQNACIDLKEKNNVLQKIPPSPQTNAEMNFFYYLCYIHPSRKKKLST